LKVLAGVWSFPTMALGFLFVLLPLWIGRQISPTGWSDGAWEWLVESGSRLHGKAKTWAAFSLGWSVVYFNDNHRKSHSTRIHERVHLKQQLILGIFHWFFYAIFTAVVWASCRSLHSYRANPYELDARRQAGEPVGNLGPDSDGDRYPFW
jgi:hypothetical protein